MFHVKQCRFHTIIPNTYNSDSFEGNFTGAPRSFSTSGWIPALFPDAEVAKYHIQDVLDVDATDQAAQRIGGDPQFYGQ